MERIAIIDHEYHKLYVEDIPDEILDAPEWDDEEAYIKDNYTFEGKWSWDYIVDTEYFPEGESDFIEVNFEDL